MAKIVEGEAFRQAVDPFPDIAHGALARGWHSLIFTAHGVVAAAGFLLPWVPVLAVLALVIGFVVRRRRKARQPTSTVTTNGG